MTRLERGKHPAATARSAFERAQQLLACLVVFCFFFQAEDGIRAPLVTGVQTCALPIWSRRRPGRWWVVSTQISLEGANPDRTGRHEPGSTSPQDGRRRLSKRGRRGRVIAVVVVVMVAAAGGAVYVRTDAFHAQPSATAASSGATTGLAQITKGNLAARSVQNGTLGYAGDHEVVNRASGTLTALPKVGDVVRTGKVLYRVDGKPVVLLKGAQTPVYRALSNGIEGADVQQLNAALVALGYTTSSKLDPNSDEFGSSLEL